MKNNGFTLVELMVVIAIVGILAAIVSSQFNNHRSEENETEITVENNTVESIKISATNTNKILNSVSWGVEDWEIEAIGMFRTEKMGVFKLCVEGQGLLLFDDNNRLAVTTFNNPDCNSNNIKVIEKTEREDIELDYIKLDY